MASRSFTRVTAAAFFGVALLVPSVARAQVAYFGGRVISNAEIVEVAWGPSVDAGYTAQLQGFYTTVVASPFMDWMSEYDTIGKTGANGSPGSNQHIGRGTFGGLFTITPANGAANLSELDISGEIAAQIASGGLPAPELDAGGNVNTLYMIDFPPSVQLSLQGLPGCVYWAAYHWSVSVNGLDVPFGVHPDCGFTFDQETDYHSHELAEAVTDAEVGLVDLNAPEQAPLSWATPAATSDTMQEVGDLCESTSSPDNIGGYVVQRIWSNYANGCVAQIPICDGTAAPPSCRACTAYDAGAACSGATAACATSGANAGHCVACDADTDCGAMVCDMSTNTCRGCATDAECSTGHCDLTADSTQGSCVACNADDDCGVDQVCSAHACAAAPPAEATTSSSTSGSASSGGVGATTGGDPNADDETTSSDAITGSCACRAVSTPVDSRAPWAAAWVLALAQLARRRRARRETLS